MGILNGIQEFFEPQPGWVLETPLEFRRQRQIQALWIGILVFLLSIVLYYGNQTSECFRDSISHSYYISSGFEGCDPQMGVRAAANFLLSW